MKNSLKGRMAAAAGVSAIAVSCQAGAPPTVTVPLNTHSAVQTGYASETYYPSSYSGYEHTGSYAPGFPFAVPIPALPVPALPGLPIPGALASFGDDGYSPPSRYPVERLPVQYLRYYPQAWYGLPGSALPQVAPQVYMPTDTTQLGFYHQRVPTWQPVPGMIPPPPNPALLHSYGDPSMMGAGHTISTGERVVSERVISSSTGSTPEIPKATSLPLTRPNATDVPTGRNIVPAPAPPAN